MCFWLVKAIFATLCMFMVVNGCILTCSTLRSGASLATHSLQLRYELSVYVTVLLLYGLCSS